MEVMRLQKFLAAAGVCSRRKGEELIQKGLVTVNGSVVSTPGTKVDPSSDTIEFNGERVEIKKDYLYIALNKPVNYETTCKKTDGKIVLDIVKVPERIYPVGRLDKDSDGLILLTNDGRIHHRLSHPSFEHEKEYVVKTKKRLSDRDLSTMGGGMKLKEFSTSPCSIKRLSPSSFNIVLKEGKNRQIRRMVEGVGNEVVKLTRMRISTIRLGALRSGSWRYLSEPEKKQLLDTLFSGRPKKRKKIVVEK